MAKRKKNSHQNSENEKPDTRAQIVVAIIGAVAVVLAAIITIIPELQKDVPLVISQTPPATNEIAALTFTQAPIVTVTDLQATNTPQPSLAPTETYSLTPASLSAEFTDAKGIEMILVSAGEFTMGSNYGELDEQPAHKIFVGAFYIDKYEVTNGLYRVCVDQKMCQEPKATSSKTHSVYFGNSDFDGYPVIYVDWNMAQSYCEWRGMRLPTEAEWEKAARGINGRTYPWGEGINCDKANYNLCVGDVSKVGSYENGISPYGIEDMAGNVLEWVSDWYQSDYYHTIVGVEDDPKGPMVGDVRVLKGGAWNDKTTVRSSFRAWDNQTYTTNYYGFRCAKDATP